MAKKPKKPETDEAPADGEAQPKKAGLAGLLKNKLVLGGVAVVLLLGAGGGAWFMGFLGGGETTAEAAAATEAAKPVTFVDLPEMTINLVSPDRAAFLRVRIALEVAEAKIAEDIQPMMPRVLDAFQTFMRELRPSDLQGSAGLFRLKEELTKRVNVAVYPAKIDAVLFKEMVVQ